MGLAIYMLISVGLVVVLSPESIKDAKGALIFMTLVSVGIIIYHYAKNRR